MEYLDKTGTQELIDKLKAYIDANSGSGSLQLNDMYPVGAMYLTIDKDFDPATTFGGTWEKVEDGRYLMCANDKYEPGTTGGSNTHTLTIDEMPAHNHTIAISEVKNASLSTSSWSGTSGPVTSTSRNLTTTSVGGGNAFYIQPNYYTIIAWRRTA